MKFYNLYDLDTDKLNALIEKGECFNVQSSVSPKRDDRRERDTFWSSGDVETRALSHSDKR